MSVQSVLALVQAAQLLIAAGVATEQEIKSFIQSLKGVQLSDADLNAILDHVIADATARKAQALAQAQATS